MAMTFSSSFGTSVVSESTSFGFYDDDSNFQIDAQKFAVQSTRKLGFPVLQVELFDSQIYSCYEEAISEYGALVNTANTKNFLFSLLGQSTSSNLTHKYPNVTTEFTDRQTEPYLRQAGANVPQTLHSASFILSANQQLYDLRNNLPDIHTGSRIEVHEIWHYAPSSINRALSAWYGGTNDVQLAFTEEFGADFGLIGNSALYSIYPHTFTIQRAQQIELNDRIRRSEFTYHLHDNVCRIFPVPKSVQQGLNVWFTYYIIPLDAVSNDSIDASDNEGVIVDISNVPYSNMNYSQINAIGLQWVRNYAHECVREILGLIRTKFNQIPIPDAEIQLNGEQLINSSQTEKTRLRESLFADLESLNIRKIAQEEAEMAQALQDKYRHAPMPLYCG